MTFRRLPFVRGVKRSGRYFAALTATRRCGCSNLFSFVSLFFLVVSLVYVCAQQMQFILLSVVDVVVSECLMSQLRRGKREEREREGAAETRLSVCSCMLRRQLSRCKSTGKKNSRSLGRLSEIFDLAGEITQVCPSSLSFLAYRTPITHCCPGCCSLCCSLWVSLSLSPPTFDNPLLTSLTMAPVAASSGLHSTTMASCCVAIYIVNPNSSDVVTAALASNLSPQTPPGCTLHFVTGPSSAPASIQDVSESVISAAETFRLLVDGSPGGDLSQHAATAFLIACFSDHPLVGMVRCKTRKPVIHLLEAAVIHSLSVGEKFGVLTTGRSVVGDVEAGVRKVLGGNSDRYVGTHATGLGVVELKEGCVEKVHERLRKGAQQLVAMGADVIVLGCAGMTGMEDVVRQACVQVGQENIKVVDGAKAGLHILAGLARVNYST